MVDGVLYTTAGTRRAVVALDAATGELLWMHQHRRGRARRRGAAAAVAAAGLSLLDATAATSGSST